MLGIERHRRLAVLCSFSGGGGVERMVSRLVRGMVAAGERPDVLLIKARGPHVETLPPEANIIHLGAGGTWSSLPALVRYLRWARPAALLAAKHRALVTVLWARRLAGVSTRVVGRLGTTVSAAIAGQGRLREWAWQLPMRRIYPWADELIAVSEGVAADIQRLSGLPRQHIHVVHNPVLGEDLHHLAAAPCPHPWLTPGQSPVITGIGRFTRQKDFSTLIRAFARLRQDRQCRLILLGEGRDGGFYETLAAALGVAEDVTMPGFVANPYAYLARSALFCLSSRWEGSPNALTEALGLGVPAVATDCPSGPREILAGGRWGPLVPVGDADALAEAIAATLAHPPAPADLRAAVADYTVEASTRHYLALLRGEAG